MASPTSFPPETYIVPVCRCDETAGTANIRAFHGTAFFINDHGAFVTARHVVEAGAHDVARNGGILGLCVRRPGGGDCVISPIRELDVANAPHDLCFGVAYGDFPTSLTVGELPVGTWRDVAALGYPATAANISADGFWMYARGFKGYVHREVKSGQLPGGLHPDMFETSFRMPPGMSGAPLFVAHGGRHVVIGVCVGVNTSEQTDYLVEEITADGVVNRERRVRIEEYGIAHDLRPLLDSTPPVFKGRTLRDVASDSAVGPPPTIIVSD
jgi:hypothetical protein